MPDLAAIVKAYDVRGLVGTQLDEEVARALGAAFADLVGNSAGTEPKTMPTTKPTTILTGHDMRASGPGLSRAFADGAQLRGADVVEIGLASTDLLYYASGSLELPGAMFTASHNPADYNGIKMFRARAVPVGSDTGLIEVRDTAQAYLDAQTIPAGDRRGSRSQRNLLAPYAQFLRELVDLSAIRPLKVVVDAGNGMAGYTVPAVLGDTVLPALPVELVELYFELDGTFPNHEANPLQPANIVDLQKAVVREGADIGLAFDGDADRCFFVGPDGQAISPSAITGLVAVLELAKAPGSPIIYNLITSRAVPEIVREHGGRPIRTRVGHSYIKAEMAETNAVFGGEHSAHYYFRDFWFADTGMLAALHVLAALGAQDGSLTDLVAPYSRYCDSGEINSTVTDAAGRVDALRAAFADRITAFDELDGLTLDLADGAWLNVRSSNTEPLLRLNVEAPDETTLAAVRDEALAIIRDASPSVGRS